MNVEERVPRSLITSLIGFQPKYQFALAAFLVPLLVRLLPEVLMGQYLLGFDTIAYYVPVVERWVSGGYGFLQVMAMAPLFYSIVAGFVLAGVNVVWVLKIMAPVLHGFLGLAIYVYARRGFGWGSGKSLLVTSLATLYFVALRISWDMLRSELALIFLFAFLMLSHGWEGESWKRFMALVSVAVLVALSHQLVSLVMFSVIVAFCLQHIIRKEYGSAWRLFLLSLPSIAVFGLVFYSNYVVSAGLMFGGTEWLLAFGFGPVRDVLVSTVGFLLFCFLPLLPFVWVGWKGLKGLGFRAWIGWCLFGVFLGVFASSGWFPLSYRWSLLVVFPLAFLAVEGFSSFRFRRLRKVLAGFLVFLTSVFLLLPANFAFPYFSTVYANYVPSSMLQNTVPLGDCGDVVRVMGWCKVNVNSQGTVLLLHDVFYGWGLLYDGNGRIFSYGYENVEMAALNASSSGFQEVYVVWWTAGEGWHGMVTLPSSFGEVYRSGRMAVYKYVKS